MEALLQHRWPGNIRELENAIERACVTSRDDVIRPENLPAEILKPSRPRSQLPVDLSRPLTEQLTELTAAFEERYLRRALQTNARAHRPHRRAHRPLTPHDHRETGPLPDRQGRVQERLAPGLTTTHHIAISFVRAWCRSARKWRGTVLIVARDALWCVLPALSSYRWRHVSIETKEGRPTEEE